MNRRALSRAVALALAAALFVSLPAQASNVSANGSGGILQTGLWSGRVYYGTAFTRNYEHSEGITEWVVSNLQTEAAIENGVDCDQAGYCIDWRYTGKAEFKNSAGTVISTVLLTAPPTNAYCRGDVLNNPRWKYLHKCKTTAFYLPSSVTTVKFTWSVAVERRDGYWFSAAQATATVAM